jgi:hypothetical protein
MLMQDMFPTCAIKRILITKVKFTKIRRFFNVSLSNDWPYEVTTQDILKTKENSIRVFRTVSRFKIGINLFRTIGVLLPMLKLVTVCLENDVIHD